MNKIFLLLFISIGLNAKCVYIDCTTSVQSATSSVISEMQTYFTQTDTELEEFEKAYDDYIEALKIHNMESQRLTSLTVEYLRLLKEINFLKESIISEDSKDVD